MHAARPRRGRRGNVQVESTWTKLKSRRRAATKIMPKVTVIQNRNRNPLDLLLNPSTLDLSVGRCDSPGHYILNYKRAMDKPSFPFYPSPHLHLPSILRQPDFMCWLCRHEIEVSPRPALADDPVLHLSLPWHRPSLCRIIASSPRETHISGIGCRLTPTHHDFYSQPGTTLLSYPVIFSVPPYSHQDITSPNPTDALHKAELVKITGPVYTRHAWTFRVHADCWDVVAARASCPPSSREMVALATTWARAMAALNWDSVTFVEAAQSDGRFELPRLLLDSVGKKQQKKKRVRYPRGVSTQRPETFDALALDLGVGTNNTVSEIVRPEDYRLVFPLRAPNSNPSTAPVWSLELSPVKGKGTRPPKDIFTFLPPELLHPILTLLPTPSIASLRLASRAVASLTADAATALPRRFWRSRFGVSFEMGFALPVDCSFPSFSSLSFFTGGLVDKDDKNMDRDWQGLYFGLKKAMDNFHYSPSQPPSPSRPLSITPKFTKLPRSAGKKPASYPAPVRDRATLIASLAKRKHHWAQFSPLVSLCQIWCDLPLSGHAFDWITDPSCDVLSGAASYPNSTNTSQIILREPSCLALAARLHRRDGLPRPGVETVCLPLDEGIAGIGVSVVDLAEQKYISGLRVLSRRAGLERKLGYVVRELETVVDFHPGERWMGLRYFRMVAVTLAEVV
ncbi:hypothetical protein B0T18DRAFT_392469 [Schizothecium vesticola]|uniref:F-box domain-containing protein n=1 Tax=Schizothecium vesticola TaxID=314040 RepID=A0AA40K2X9_9PEZI|nr:hypothetical protein B0T18DRAFT_392469 [Schizothecium vesticola]